MSLFPSYKAQGAYHDSGPFNAAAITLSGDSSFSTQPLRGIWVGTTGNIVVDMAGTGTTITFQNVPVGYISGHFTKVYSTANGTTASNLVAVW